MNAGTFFDNLSSHESLNLLHISEGTRPSDDRVFVLNKSEGAKYSISVSTVLEHDWEEIEAVLLGERQSRILAHMSRIVGYFSQIENWNKSKLGELRARRAGDYALVDDVKRTTRTAEYAAS